MRIGITSRYNSKTAPLLHYLAERLGVEPKQAQVAAVVALAKEMIDRDRKAMNAIAADADAAGGVPAVPGEAPNVDGAELPHTGDGSEGDGGGVG